MSNNRLENVTIIQVAQEAGVSAQTVSRVLNNRPDVSAATRERILGVIERLNYKPNAIARGLVQRKTHSLGVIAAGLEKYGPLRTVIGIEQETRTLGYSLLLSLIPDDATESQVEEALEHLLGRQVDGVLWSAPEIGANRIWLDSLLERLTVPTVFMSMHPHPAVTVIDTDNRMGGRLATTHLIEQGRRRVAHICGPQSQWSALPAKERDRHWATAVRLGGCAARRWIRARRCAVGGGRLDGGKRLCGDSDADRAHTRPGRCFCWQRSDGAWRAAGGERAGYSHSQSTGGYRL